MKIRSRVVLENAIDTGIRNGYARAFKHSTVPNDESVCNSIETAIWHELDTMFIFDTDYID